VFINKLRFISHIFSSFPLQSGATWDGEPVFDDEKNASENNSDEEVDEFSKSLQ